MFEHLTSQIQNADTKASLILGVDAILVGTLATLVAQRIQSFSNDVYTPAGTISVCLLGLVLLLLGASIYFSLVVTRPSIQRAKDGGLFYFNMIRAMAAETFIERFETLTPQPVRHDLLAQVHALAGIAQGKSRRNTIALNCL